MSLCLNRLQEERYILLPAGDFIEHLLIDQLQKAMAPRPSFRFFRKARANTPRDFGSQKMGMRDTWEGGNSLGRGLIQAGHLVS